jgi:flagellar biosynthesis protein FliQ
VYIHIQKGAYCLLLISAIILFDALSVGMVVNAFGHANSLQLTTL